MQGGFEGRIKGAWGMVYAALFVISVIYALILYHLSRRCWPALVNHLPWFAVVWLAYVAVGLSYLISWEALDRVVGLLAVSLVPMIVAYCVASYQREQRLVEYLSRRQYDRAEKVARACGPSADGGDRQGTLHLGESAEE